jgi:putative tricarboxylic transport membrane protein
MSEATQTEIAGTAAKGIVSRKTAELAFAALILIYGVILIIGALEMETGWGSSGPEAGYFPLRIGILIILAALAVLAKEAIRPGAAQRLVDPKAASNIILFALPLLALIAITPWAGLYLSAAGYLAVSIGLVGGVRWPKTFAISVLTTLAMFLLFEFAFRTPLPKGPLGPLLGML